MLLVQDRFYIDAARSQGASVMGGISSNEAIEIAIENNASWICFGDLGELFYREAHDLGYYGACCDHLASDLSVIDLSQELEQSKHKAMSM